MAFARVHGPRWLLALAALVLLTSLATYLLPPHYHDRIASLPQFFSKTEPNAVSVLDYWMWQNPSRFESLAQTHLNQTENPCARFPTYLLRNIQVVLKIGAGEESRRIDTHLSSVTRCISNLLVFSDADHKAGPHQAHDVLGDLNSAYWVNNSDYDVYLAQKRQYLNGNLASHEQGWRLDRYKFIPMVERAQIMNPVAKWFVFLESDTFCVWDNLFRLLENYNPSVPLYFGSPSPGRQPGPEEPPTWFANGGPGFVLSHAAATKLTARTMGVYGEYEQPQVSTRYVNDVRGDCCGDSVLGWALWQSDVHLSGLWPMFNPHSLQGVPFSDRYWCQPVITMHKTAEEHMHGLWQWQQDRERTRPLLYADMLEYTQMLSIDRRDDWDNGGWDDWQHGDESPAHRSYEDCRIACHNDKPCLQFTYQLRRCIMVGSIRLGSSRQPEDGPLDIEQHFTQDERRWKAGWDLDKISRWVESHPCPEAQWSKPSITRIY